MEKLQDAMDFFASKKSTPISNVGKFMSLVIFPILVGTYTYFLFIDVNAGIRTSNMDVARTCPEFQFTCAAATDPYGCEVAPVGDKSKRIFAEDANKHLHNGTMKPGERGNFVLCPGYTDGLDISLRASQNFNPAGEGKNTPIAASCRAPSRYLNLGIFVGESNGLIYIVDLKNMQRKVTFDLKAKLMVSQCSSLCLSTGTNVGGAGDATLISCDGKIIAINPSFENFAETTAKILVDIDPDFKGTTGVVDPKSNAAFIAGMFGDAKDADDKPRLYRVHLRKTDKAVGVKVGGVDIKKDIQASMVRWDGQSEDLCVREASPAILLGNGRNKTVADATCAEKKTQGTCTSPCKWRLKSEGPASYNIGYFGDNDGTVYIIQDMVKQGKEDNTAPVADKLNIAPFMSGTNNVGIGKTYGAITAFGNNEEENHKADHVLIGTGSGTVLQYNADFNKEQWKATLSGGQVMVIADDKYANTQSFIGTNYPGTLYTLNKDNGRISQATDMDGSITTGFMTTDGAVQNQAYIATEEGVVMKMTSDLQKSTDTSGKEFVSGAGKWKHLSSVIGYIRRSEDLNYDGTPIPKDIPVSDETHFQFPPAGEGSNVFTMVGARVRDVKAQTLNASFLAYDAVAVAGFTQHACQTKQADTYCKRINLSPLTMDVLISPQYSTLQVVSIYLAFVFAVIYGLLFICTKAIVREMNLKTVWNANPFADPKKPPQTELTTGRRKSEFKNPMMDDEKSGDGSPQRRPSALIKKIRSSQKKVLENADNAV